MQNNNHRPFAVNNQSPATAPSNFRSIQPSLNPQQYAHYMATQRYYAQQQQLYLQQRQQQQQQQQQQHYAQYYQSVAKQRQQHQYLHYCQQIAQQYGYPAMIQAINANQQHLQRQRQYQQQSPARPRSGPIMLSSEEQPLLASDNNTHRRRGRRRKRKRKKPDSDDEDDSFDSSQYIRHETVSIDIENDDDTLLGLDKDGYDRFTLINENERLPDINSQFDEWLYFSKKIWKRQKKYKHFATHPNHNTKRLDLSETISTSPSNSSDTVELKSAFLTEIE